MTPEHEAELYRLAPTLYADRHGDPRHTLMCFGFECGDGWFELLKELSIALEALSLKEPEEERPPLLACQVKQKLGGLRFYLAGAPTPAMRDAIDRAQGKSWEVCEDCGAVGAPHIVGHWVRSEQESDPDRKEWPWTDQE